MKLFDARFEGVEKSLDLRVKRHALLASNVANSETPNYKARELDFAGQLEKAFGASNEELKKTNSNHMDLSIAEGEHITFDHSGALGADGNNVDLDIEMGKISANGRAYEMATNLLVQKFKMMRMFVKKGGF